MTQSSMPAGRIGLIPHLVCDPCSEAIEFYKKAFDAQEKFRLSTESGEKFMHVEMTICDASFFMADDFPEYCEGKSQSPKSLGGTPVTIHRYVPDCDAAIAQAEAAGATVKMPATDMFWGDRYGMVVDPFGHTWSFATPQRQVEMDELKQAVKSMGM
ncbi:VOC family protein [Blastopirellula marina]|uniref:VOC family protein n=1 Tax=Blastopirellula marina TaxID=124 RepID=A0A2S8F703_9BACT|nr:MULTISPECIES: VOC family protein [Pirellulaceae]PQO27932.1 VOC family protein [Blastopirellula marina]RCS48357.1 VOC family protein [Bremerella cremea]